MQMFNVSRLFVAAVVVVGGRLPKKTDDVAGKGRGGGERFDVVFVCLCAREGLFFSGGSLRGWDAHRA